MYVFPPNLNPPRSGYFHQGSHTVSGSINAKTKKIYLTFSLIILKNVTGNVNAPQVTPLV